MKVRSPKRLLILCSYNPKYRTILHVCNVHVNCCVGATDCLTCPTGNSCTDGVATPCSTGTYSNNGNCITCPEGLYSNGEIIT